MALKTVVAALLLALPLASQTQINFYRISLDFSIKEKRSDGTFSLQMGKAYYDIKQRKLLYELSFPEKKKILTTDSLVYLIEEGGKILKEPIPGFIEMSIFHLGLTGNLKSFGLKDSPFEETKVEKSNDMTITTWEVSEEKQNPLIKGKILTSVKNRELYGVVFFDENDELQSKQFYLNYENIKGINIPTKVIYIIYQNGEEQYRTMNFKNIVVNEMGNNDLYDYPIPQQ